MSALNQYRRSARALVRRSYVVEPPREVYEQAEGEEYLDGFATYSAYNYLGDGPVTRVKSAHFEAALDLVRDRFGRTGAVDFGTADGFLLPTLRRRFDPVVAIDDDPKMTAVAQRLVDRADLDVTVINNRGMDWDGLRSAFDRERFGVLFLLETLEHIGTADDMIESRLAFVSELFGIVADDARIVISVPNMVGIPFGIQRAVMAATGAHREPISRTDLAKAVVLKDTEALEPRWQRHDHLGFNHRKLERGLRERFTVVGKRDLVFSKVYAVTR